MKDAIKQFISLSKEARHALDRVRDPVVKLTYPKDELPHELMVSGLICRNADDRWLISPRGLEVITNARVSDDATAQYYAMPGVCRRILKSMLGGRVNVDPFIPATLRCSGFIKETDAGWVMTDLFKQVKEV